MALASQEVERLTLLLDMRLVEISWLKTKLEDAERDRKRSSLELTEKADPQTSFPEIESSRQNLNRLIRAQISDL